MNKNFVYALIAFVCFTGIISCEKNLTDIQDDSNKDNLNTAIASRPAGASTISLSISRFNPNPVIAGDSVKVFIKLTAAAPAGGLVVTIDKVRSAGPLAGLPKTFLIPAGATSGSVSIRTLPYQEIIYEYVTASLPNFESTSPQPLEIDPRPQGDPRPPLQTFEAENAVLKNAVAKVGTNYTKMFFSNGAFVQYTGKGTSSVLFNVTPSKAGENILEVRYAWSTSDNQKEQELIVIVNGKQYPLIFTPTANDHSNNLIYVDANLNAGNNTISVVGTGGNAAKLRLDNLTVAVP